MVWTRQLQLLGQQLNRHALPWNTSTNENATTTTTTTTTHTCASPHPNTHSDAHAHIHTYIHAHSLAHSTLNHKIFTSHSARRSCCTETEHLPAKFDIRKTKAGRGLISRLALVTVAQLFSLIEQEKLTGQKSTSSLLGDQDDTPANSNNTSAFHPEFTQVRDSALFPVQFRSSSASTRSFPHPPILPCSLCLFLPVCALRRTPL
jgi:hypothetical protein